MLIDGGHVALKFQSNYLYQGPQSGKRVDLLLGFQNSSNYIGSNDAYIIDTSNSLLIYNNIISITLIISSTILFMMNTIIM